MRPTRAQALAALILCASATATAQPTVPAADAPEDPPGQGDPQPASTEEAPDARDPALVEKARGAFDRGNHLLAQGDETGAIGEFKLAYELAGRPSSLFMLGVAYRRQFEETGDLNAANSAIENYGKFIAEAPTHIKVREARETLTLVRAVVAAAKASQPRGAPAGDLSMFSRAYRQSVGYLAEGRFAEAIETAKQAHGECQSSGELAQVWLVEGRALALSGQGDAAAERLMDALSVDPQLRFDGDMDAPDTAAFETARTALRGKAPLAISVASRDTLRSTDPVVVDISIDSDPRKLVGKLVVHYRLGGADSFAQLEGKPGDPLVLPVSMEGKDDSVRIFFYASAVDSAGAPVAMLGSPSSPRSLEVLSEAQWNERFPDERVVIKEGRSVPRWVWFASAALAVGGGLSIDLLSPSAENRELDVLDLTSVGLYAAGAGLVILGVF